MKGETMKKETQEQKVLRYLKGHKGITRYIAMERLHVLNLPEVIRKIRVSGITVNSYICTNKKGEHWTEYSLK